jgi:hypothetical protein
VQRGVSLFKVQGLLGHSDTRMTQKYAKLDPRRVADETVIATTHAQLQKQHRPAMFSASRPSPRLDGKLE